TASAMLPMPKITGPRIIQPMPINGDAIKQSARPKSETVVGETPRSASTRTRPPVARSKRSLIQATRGSTIVVLRAASICSTIVPHRMHQLNASLDNWLARLTPTIDDEQYVFARSRAQPSGSEYFAIVREPAAFTVVVAERVALAIGLEPLLRCRRIDTGVDTPLDGVGFLA